MPGTYAVTSNPEVNRTLATLRNAELGFLGVVVEKSTNGLVTPLSLYRTVNGTSIPYGSSFGCSSGIRRESDRDGRERARGVGSRVKGERYMRGSIKESVGYRYNFLFLLVLI